MKMQSDKARKIPAELFGYVFAAVTVGAALLLTLVLWNWIAPHSTLLFLAAIVITAWRVGVYPSLAAMFLAVLAMDYFFNPPLFALEISINNLASTVVFIIVALLIGWIDADRKRILVERDRLLESEKQARIAAEDANRAKDQFLAMVTHELRAPLNTIIGWAQVLRQGKFGEKEVSTALSAIERNAFLQSQLVSDLLDISRIRAGKFHVDLHPIDLASCLRAAIESIEPAIMAKHIKLETIFDENVPQVMGDSDRLQQVFWNLLSNAVKFTPKNWRIDVRLECSDKYARVAVSDTGIGISSEFLPFVFDAFSQFDDTAKNKHGGLGLGLAIVRHLVEAHGGTIKAKSAGKNLGATFIVELPLIKSYEEAETVRNTKMLEKSLIPHSS
jgi:signal transduction histidine kinase